MRLSDPMFAGEIHDSAARIAADLAAKLDKDEQSAADFARLAHELGWTVALLPEERGGLEIGYAGLCSIAEAAGAEGSPVPLAAAACAVPELAGCFDIDERTRIDGMLTEGAHVTAVLASAVEDQIAEEKLTARIDGETVTLDGTLAGIEGIAEPASLLVAVPTDTGAVIVEVSESVDYKPGPRMDTRLGLTARFRDAAFPIIAELTADTMQRIEDRCALVVASEAIGAAFRGLDLTINYLNEREQFGTVLSTYQVLRHKAVDVFVAVMTARGAVMEAVMALDAGEPADEAVALATLNTRRAARLGAKEIVQLHGGIGMTNDLPAAKLARRLLMTDYEYGSSARTLARLSQGA